MLQILQYVSTSTAYQVVAEHDVHCIVMELMPSCCCCGGRRNYEQHEQHPACRGHPLLYRSDEPHYRSTETSQLGALTSESIEHYKPTCTLLASAARYTTVTSSYNITVTLDLSQHEQTIHLMLSHTMTQQHHHDTAIAATLSPSPTTHSHSPPGTSTTWPAVITPMTLLLSNRPAS